MSSSLLMCFLSCFCVAVFDVVLIATDPHPKPTSSAPTTFTISPTAIPSSIPTSIPTAFPTTMPTTNHSTVDPSNVPTSVPTSIPTLFPTENPSYAPTPAPTPNPVTNAPSPTTVRPIILSSAHPSSYPSSPPSADLSSFHAYDGGGGGVAVVLDGGVATADAVVTVYLSVGIIAGCACTAIAAVSLIALAVYRRKQTVKLESLKAEAEFESMFESGMSQTAPLPEEGVGDTTVITDTDYDLAVVTEDAEFGAVAEAAAARNLSYLTADGNHNNIFESAIESEYNTANDQTYVSLFKRDIFESAIESAYDPAYDQTYASVYETAR